MLLTVLSVPECPNVEVLLDRLHDVLGKEAVDVGVVVVADDEHARAWGMTGSPTLLIDGVDPFAVSGVEASVSCRLYRGGDCSIGGAPSTTDLREVLGAVVERAPADGYIVDAAGRGGRGRLAPQAGGLRAVQQGVLRAMATFGRLPAPHDVDRLAEPFGRHGADVLRELDAEDYLTLDATGGIRAAYPFSAVATRHRARIEDGPQVWAMCAVDALGIAAMLDRRVVIDTTDPITTDPIRIDVRPGAVNAEPASTVVYVGGRPQAGPAEQTCCAAINFFGSPHSATRWAAVHPEVHGEIVDLAGAEHRGRAIFGALLGA